MSALNQFHTLHQHVHKNGRNAKRNPNKAWSLSTRDSRRCTSLTRSTRESTGLRCISLTAMTTDPKRRNHVARAGGHHYFFSLIANISDEFYLLIKMVLLAGLWKNTDTREAATRPAASAAPHAHRRQASRRCANLARRVAAAPGAAVHKGDPHSSWHNFSFSLPRVYTCPCLEEKKEQEQLSERVAVCLRSLGQDGAQGACSILPSLDCTTCRGVPYCHQLPC